MKKCDFFKDDILKSYDLDDFTRFPTVEDAIREFVSEAWLRKSTDGAAFNVPYTFNKSGSLDTALVLVNGIPVDPDWVLNLNPVLIDKIDVYQDQVKVGSWEYRGIVNFQLYEYDGDRLSLPSNYKEFDYEIASPGFQSSAPDYSQPAYARIPDFRSQLFWKAHVESDGSPKQFTFFTSDNEGIFEVTVSGVVDDQSYILEKRTFEVEKKSL